jgi:hypothetical protein
MVSQVCRRRANAAEHDFEADAPGPPGLINSTPERLPGPLARITKVEDGC